MPKSSEMAKTFWIWWSSLNSPTRQSSPDNRLAPGADGEAIEEDKLRVPGKQGWLGLLYLLMIWRKRVGNGSTTDWDAAVADVYWVTRRLVDNQYFSDDASSTLKRCVSLIVALRLLTDPLLAPDHTTAKLILATRALRGQRKLSTTLLYPSSPRYHVSFVLDLYFVFVLDLYFVF